MSAGYTTIGKHSPEERGGLVNHCVSGVLEACALVRSTELWSYIRAASSVFASKCMGEKLCLNGCTL